MFAGQCVLGLRMKGYGCFWILIFDLAFKHNDVITHEDMVQLRFFVKISKVHIRVDTSMELIIVHIIVLWYCFAGS